jgi:hypothetical protein
MKKINSMGKPLFSGDPTRQAVFPGKLKVMENRIHALGRVVVTASIIDTIDANAATLIELYDAVLLWADEKRMRMRGFEDIGRMECQRLAGVRGSGRAGRAFLPQIDAEKFTKSLPRHH